MLKNPMNLPADYLKGLLSSLQEKNMGAVKARAVNLAETNGRRRRGRRPFIPNPGLIRQKLKLGLVIVTIPRA